MSTEEKYQDNETIVLNKQLGETVAIAGDRLARIGGC